ASMRRGPRGRRPPRSPSTTLFRSVRKPRASAGPDGDSKRPECQTDGAGAGRRARSLRSAETGIYKKFLSNRSGTRPDGTPDAGRSEEHTSELQSRFELVCRPLLDT